jgi:hypothetical protein
LEFANFLRLVFKDNSQGYHIAELVKAEGAEQRAQGKKETLCPEHCALSYNSAFRIPQSEFDKHFANFESE